MIHNLCAVSIACLGNVPNQETQTDSELLVETDVAGVSRPHRSFQVAIAHATLSKVETPANADCAAQLRISGSRMRATDLGTVLAI